MPLDLRDALGDRPEWLLDLTSADGVLRFAREPVEVEVNGETHGYLGGLEWSEEVSDAVNTTGGLSPKRVDLTVWAPANIDLPAMIESGLDVASMTGTLRRWSPTTGTVEVVVAGVVRGVEYGSPDEPLTFTLEEVEEDDAGRFPPVGARVTSTTWPNASEQALGEWYPWIIGEPGAGTAPVAPALFVDTSGDRLLVAGHPVEASTVLVLNDDDGTSATIAVAHVADGAGRLCALVDLSGSGVTIDAAGTYFVAWGTAGGGLCKGDGTALVGAGDVLTWMLGFSTLRLDRGRLAAAVPELNAFRIDTSIIPDPGTRFGPWEWVADHLLEILPVSVRFTDDGLAILPWRLEPVPGDAVARIEVPAAGSMSATASRRTAVSYSERGDVANTFALSYGHDPRSDVYSRRLVLTGDPDVKAQDEDAVLDFGCAVSRTRYRDAAGHPLVLTKEATSEAVWEQATAAAILRCWVARYSRQAQIVGYSVDRAVAAHVQPGDLVLVTDADLRWTDKLCSVEEVTLGSVDTIDIDCRVINDPAASRRS